VDSKYRKDHLDLMGDAVCEYGIGGRKR